MQLWLASDFKGAAVSLDSSRCCRPPPGEDEELMTPDAPSLHVDKPFAFGFDVLEVGEPSLFSAEARAQGLQAGPVLHCTRSRHYDLASPRFREWLVHLVCTKQVRALLLRPSTDTFARAGHPPCVPRRAPLALGEVSVQSVVRIGWPLPALRSCWPLPATVLRHASSIRSPPCCVPTPLGFPSGRGLCAKRRYLRLGPLGLLALLPCVSCFVVFPLFFRTGSLAQQARGKVRAAPSSGTPASCVT